MNESVPRSPFIPAWLDDLGLTATEYRVFCNLTRRSGGDGKCHPAISSITKTCRISENTAWKALRKLEVMGLIVREKHFRNSNRYQVATSPPPERITAKETVAQFESPQFEGCQSPQNRRCQSPQKRGCKGTPMKVLQLRSSLSITDFYSLDEKADGKPSAIAEQIYQSYPRKVGRVAALKAITKAMKAKDPQWLLERVEAYAKAIAWQERQYIPHPATWFNGGRYDDDPENWKDPKAQTSKPRPALAITHGRRGHEETL